MMTEHWRNMPHVCHDCGYLNCPKIAEFQRMPDSFETFKAMATGTPILKKITGVYRCPFCGLMFQDYLGTTGDENER